MSELLKMTVPGHPEFIKVAKCAVGSAATLSGFDFECIEDIQLAVAEACKNITCHRFDGWCRSYELECEMEEDSITITVSNNMMDHSDKKGERPCQDCPKEGDLGIHIINSIMDDVKIIKTDEGNKCIIMTKRKVR